VVGREKGSAVQAIGKTRNIMKNNRFILIFLLFMSPLVIFSEDVYKNEEYHYSFVIPPGWFQIPKSTIDSYMQHTADITGAKFVDYVAGFQYGNHDTIQYPYFLIMQHKIPANYVTWNSFIKTFMDLSSHTKGYVVDGLEDRIKLDDSSNLFIDKEKRVISFNINAEVAQVESQTTLIAFLGKEGITQINIVVKKSDYTKYTSDIEKLINTFNFDNEYEYTEPEIQANSTKLVEEFPQEVMAERIRERGFRGLSSGLVWASLFGIGSMVVTLVKRNKKRKDTDKNNNIKTDKEYIYENEKKKEPQKNNIITKDDLLNELTLAEKEFNNGSFYIVKEAIENSIRRQHKEIIEFINSKQRTAKEWIYSVIGNYAGDLIETGDYHVYRGMLNIIGFDLLDIFDKSYDFLLMMKAEDLDIEYANKQKATLRRNIDKLG
jgi:hypothetical protein